MKLIILQLNSNVSEDIKNLELIRLHRMINEGVLLLDMKYKAPIIIDIESEQKRNGKTTTI